MGPKAVERRPAVAARRAGYVVAVVVNAALLYVFNVWPGWQALPFLTQDTQLVTGLVNASIVVSLVANVLFVAWDPRWFKAFGDVVTTSVGLVAVVRIWQVFPFDFGSSSIDWALVARVVLVVAIVGSAIGIVAALASFMRAVTGHHSGRQVGHV
jgi:hypothetical protein